MKRVMIVRSLLAAAAMLAQSPTVHAQAVNPKNVPLELVQGLSLGMPFEGRAAPADIYVGRLPEQTERVLPLPRGSRVIGAFAHRGFSSNLIEVAQPLEAARDTLEARLIAAGWQKHEFPGRQAGFQSNDTPGPSYCIGDSMALSPMFSEISKGRTRLVAVHMTRTPYLPCRFDQNDEMFRSPKLIPTLAAPPDAVVVSMGTLGGGDEQRSEARITTRLTVEALTKHYGDQLSAAGWKPITRVTSELLAAENYRVTDQKGTEWYGVLSVTTAGADADRVLSVYVTRAKLPR